MIENKKFYVYEWYNIETQEIFYVGKGSKNRYKDKEHRNNVFKQYIQNNLVDSRIIEYFDNEEDAFEYEKNLTERYRTQGQCQCNLIDGGYGGYSKVWTDSLKKYWSTNNPMKNEEQRQRMRDNNPMKNKDVALKVGAAHKRPVIINNIRYDGVKDAAEVFKIDARTMSIWCSQGGNTQGDICRYEDEEQKQYVFTSKSFKAVIIDDIEYPTIKEAAQQLHLSYSGLSKILKKMLKQNQESIIYHNHICKYANQQPSQ